MASPRGFEPRSEAYPDQDWSPEASVISKLHYGPINEVIIEDD